ncbi:DUF3043 domain-containing protein [Sanguibacter hominis ATCC BAA-789]|uniref:DUF3043 domain-containing protein n=1 Tax=Sanguibacter hominis ATCC BAA-789 TaxID=1312740 RepID=A0A9X5FBR5_9MICO|nr:DUF3043 domain-containing protein [Sanguibacter hominis ATCC BAA-789]
MFSKKTRQEPQAAEPAPELDHSAPVNDKTKSGPTPKRREREAANRVPLVPGDRKAAARAERAAMRVQRDLEYKALQTGDERNLPPRDKGPERRFVRDFVDARWNLGELFLFVALAMMVIIMVVGNTGNPVLIGYTTLALYAVVLVTILDGFLMWRRLKKALLAKFGTSLTIKPLRWYAVARAFQIRRARLPKPMVRHGQYPS